MGRVTTPKYRLEIIDNRIGQVLGLHNATSWSVVRQGRPTDANLERYIFRYAESLKHDGVNAHLSRALGFVPFPREARVINQRTGAVVAHWKAATFQVF